MKFKITKEHLLKEIFITFEDGKWNNMPDEMIVEGEPIKTLKDCHRNESTTYMGCDGLDCTTCECLCHKEKPKKIEEIELLENINELYPEIADAIPNKINELIKAYNNKD